MVTPQKKNLLKFNDIEKPWNEYTYSEYQKNSSMMLH